MLKYICDFCETEIPSTVLLATMNMYSKDGKKIAKHLHKACIIEFVRAEMPEVFRNWETKISEEFNAPEEPTPEPVTEVQNEEEEHTENTDAIVDPIVEVQEFIPGRRYKGVFSDIQRIMLSKYIYDSYNPGIRYTMLTPANANHWIHKFYQEAIAEILHKAQVFETIDDAKYPVKDICVMFVNGKDFKWLADEFSCSEAVVSHVINKYAGVSLFKGE